MNLQAAYSPIDEEEAKQVLDALRALGYSISLVESEPKKDAALVLAFFSSKTKEEDFLSSMPWLKEQKKYSSIPYLRVMPFFLYHSSKEDPEVAFEGNAGTLYEDVFSGEFKPFGWDLDSSSPAAEFPRVLQDYLE